MRHNDRGEWLLFAVALLAALVIIPVMLNQRADCEARGGAYVRGLFWFECVEGRP